MNTSTAIPQWQRAILVTANIATAVLLVTSLYLAQAVLIPIAIATLLTFLLTPMVAQIERLGLGRVVSVFFVVSIVVLLFAGAVWLVFSQMSGLASDLPVYTENVNQRIRTIKRIGDSTTVDRLQKMFDDISRELVAPPEGDVKAPPEKPALTVTEGTSPWGERVTSALTIVKHGIVSIGLAIVLLVFMLLRRETLRNRLIWFAGNAHMSATTKAVDDTCNRIGRFLFTQFAINAGYGIALGSGLYFVGVSYALLWGFFAILLRYIPYLGASIAALFPIGLSLAQFPGWKESIAVFSLVVTLEIVTSQFIEPMLYGHSIGVSEVAMLVSAAFWTLLWGPIGLVLSAPMTVCVVVMGRHVPRLEFLVVLLGDEPALKPHVTYYQRLLARDQDEAEHLASSELKSSSLQVVCDTIMVPALNYAKRDRERNEMTADDEKFILQATWEILEDLGERRAPRPTAAGIQERNTAKVGFIACPARDGEDFLALQMLQQALDPARWNAQLLGADTLASELIERIEIEKPPLVCIVSLPPGGLTHTRYLCKRLRAAFPGVKILVGRWGLHDGVEANNERLRDAGADQMATSLKETVQQMESWLPILAQKDLYSVA